MSALLAKRRLKNLLLFIPAAAAGAVCPAFRRAAAAVAISGTFTGYGMGNVF